MRKSDLFIFTNLLGYFEKSGWGNENPYTFLLIEFDNFTLIKLRAFGDATLGINMRLISPEIATWIVTKDEQPVLAHVHKFEKSVLHM